MDFMNAYTNRNIPSLMRHVVTLTFADKRLSNSLKSYADRLVLLNDKFFSALSKRLPPLELLDDETERYPTAINNVRTVVRSICYGLDTLNERLSGNPGVTERQEDLLSYVLSALSKLSE